jgi:formate hydrogenlyase subunit 3/multisubunit Na+/H+ antiporter MnhD subunit
MHPSPAPTLKFPWLLLGTRLGIDTTTQVFLFFIALLWTCAGVYALHVWLPLAHPVAPTPASAVLSGAMIKAGLLGWLRFLPLGEAATPGWGNVCTIAGLAAAFDGVLVGCTQDNAKTVLAYSSISQMGFMTMAVGVGLTVPAVWTQALTATALYALHHAMDGDACVMTG